MKKLLYLLFILILFIANLNNVEAANGDYYKSSEHNISFLIRENKAILLTPHDKGGVFGDSQNAMASWNISGDGDTLCYISNSMGTNSVSYSTNCSGITLKKTDLSNDLQCSYSIDYKNPADSISVPLNIYNINGNIYSMFNNDIKNFGDNDGYNGAGHMFSTTNKEIMRFSLNDDVLESEELKNGSCPSLGYNLHQDTITYNDFIVVSFRDDVHNKHIELLNGEEEDPSEGASNVFKQFTNNLQANNIDLYELEVILRQFPDRNDLCFQLYSAGEKVFDEQCVTGETELSWGITDDDNANLDLKIKISQEMYDKIIADPEMKIYANFKMADYELNYSKITGYNFELDDEFVENNMYTEPTDKDMIETLTGQKFKEYMSKLKKPLGFTNFSYTGNSGLLGEINYAEIELGLTEEQLCLDNSDDAAYCGENVEYFIERGVKEVVDYCNTYVFGKYTEQGDKTYIDKRLKECTDFITVFYPEMVEKGVINSIESDCGFISQDLLDILQTFLNIIAIAAPILAVGLGVLDFIKVIASGDADKEMKNAGKNFLTRVGVAMILLITPLLIAYLLDIFAPIIPGLETDNPFCDIVEIE